MLTALVSTISNLQVFLLKKCEMQKLLAFFSKNISIYAIFNDQSFNAKLTNDIVSFEQFGPVCLSAHQSSSKMRSTQSGKNLFPLGKRFSFNVDHS